MSAARTGGGAAGRAVAVLCPRPFRRVGGDGMAATERTYANAVGYSLGQAEGGALRRVDVET